MNCTKCGSTNTTRKMQSENKLGKVESIVCLDCGNENKSKIFTSYGKDKKTIKYEFKNNNVIETVEGCDITKSPKYEE